MRERREGESGGVRKERGGKEEHISSHFFTYTHVLLGQSFPAGDGFCDSEYRLTVKFYNDKTIFQTMHKFSTVIFKHHLYGSLYKLSPLKCFIKFLIEYIYKFI